MSIFEIGMLVGFGSAWPVSIYKSLRAGTSKGKSLPFLIIVFLGYISGIIHKAIYSLDAVIGFYILNAVMVLIDIGLYFRNAGLDRKNGVI
jgi:lipopolysaccharide export LptBFGC system permease protein LptF